MRPEFAAQIVCQQGLLGRGIRPRDNQPCLDPVKAVLHQLKLLHRRHVTGASEDGGETGLAETGPADAAVGIAQHVALAAENLRDHWQRATAAAGAPRVARSPIS